MPLMMQLFILILLPVAFLLPPAARAGEIIGGQEARPHSRPYMAFLEIKDGNDYFSCGGFLVSENFVLTAAHCDGDKIMVYLGAHNISQREPSWQETYASRHFPYPQYDNATYNNDIMLLKLSKKVTLTKAVNTIKLPLADARVPPGTMCSAAGWGLTSLTDTTDTLREVNLTVTSDRICDSHYRHYYNASSMLCAGDPHDNKTSYQGDSGGPLVCGGVAEGIVSYGKSDARPPRVFTRISPFLPWINDTMTHF